MAFTQIGRTGVVSLALVAWAVSPAISLADEASAVLGKTLFQNEWEFKRNPTLPDGSWAPTRFDSKDRTRLKKQAAQLEGDGLGPLYNATSCEACHARGGSAGVERNVTTLTIDPRSPVIEKLALNHHQHRAGVKRSLNQLYPALIGATGNLNVDLVIHEASAASPDEFQKLRTKIHSAIPNLDPAWVKSDQRTSQTIAENPVLAGRMGDIDFYLSQRNSPALYGLGTIDRISDDRLTYVMKTQAKNTRNKISGRRSAGKFGWRGQSLNLELFVRGACAGEVGLQVSDIAHASDPADPDYASLGNDLDDVSVRHLTNYIRSLPPPRIHGMKSHASEIRRGQRIFTMTGCATCHVADIGPAKGLYSDLLLHDMGAELQAPSPAPAQFVQSPLRLPPVGGPNIRLVAARDGLDLPALSGWMRSSVVAYYGSLGGQFTSLPPAYELPRPKTPQFPYGDVVESKLPDPGVVHANPAGLWDSLQREWRTPPLWGVADSGPFLHDGRASTLDQAIRLHGGEAKWVTGKYERLSGSDRDRLLLFLRSLRAPHAPDELAPMTIAQIGPAKEAETVVDEGELSSILDAFSGGYNK